MPISPHFASRRVLLILAAMSALDAMAIDLYAPAFPTMQHAFTVTPNAIQATMSVFLVGAALGQIFIGPALDVYGRRPPIVFGGLCFFLGSLLCAFAPNYGVFVVGRLVQSLGAATAMVAPRAVIADVYEAKDIARIFSIIMQIMMVAPIISPPLGAFILLHFGWRVDFVLLAGLGLINLIATIYLLPETLPASHRTRLSVPRLLKTYWTTIWQQPFFLLMLCGGFVSGTLYAFLGASPFAFIQGYGMMPGIYSIMVAMMALAFVLVGGLNMRLVGPVSEGRLMWVGLLIQLSTAVAMIVWPRPGLVLYMLCIGGSVAALGIVFPNITALAMAKAGPNAGIGSAAVGIAQSLVSASAGLVLLMVGTNSQGMAASIAIFATLALVTFLASLRRW